MTLSINISLASLQRHHVYSTLKRRGSDRFHVVSTWNSRVEFVGIFPMNMCKLVPNGFNSFLLTFDNSLNLAKRMIDRVKYHTHRIPIPISPISGWLLKLFLLTGVFQFMMGDSIDTI